MTTKVPKRELNPTLREMTFASTPSDIAQWLILEHGKEILITHDDQLSGSDLHVLDSSGIWKRGDNVLQQWMVDHGNDLREQAVKLTADNYKSALSLMRDARPWFNPKVLPAVRMAAHAAYRVLQAERRTINIDDAETFGITLALDTDLDADLRFIGTASGVVNLDTGKLLKPEEGRKHLVTHRSPVKFVPGATHEDVDRLFFHLPEADRKWWWRVLGYALRGSPSARIYEVIGPAAGGKSGLMAALTATLGPYAGVASPGLLEYRRGAVESETGLSPGTRAMVPPRRFAIFDEVKPHRLNNKLIKDWSGDGAGVTWRTLHQEPRTDPVSATMFLLCNSGQEARLGMQDLGMQRRLRTLRYPAIPPDDVIDDFNTRRVHDPAFQRALLWRLVDEASAGTTGSPPEAPASVIESTAERIADDVGEIGIFAKRIVRGNGTLTVPEVWSAWCLHNDEPEDAAEPGGISRQRLSRILRNGYVDGLPAPKQVKVAGKPARGWRGWQLLDDVPDEADGILPFPITADRYHLAADVRRPDGTTLTKDTALNGGQLDKLHKELAKAERTSRSGMVWGRMVWTSPVRIGGELITDRNEQDRAIRNGMAMKDPSAVRVEPEPGAKRYVQFERFDPAERYGQPPVPTPSLFKQDDDDIY